MIRLKAMPERTFVIKALSGERTIANSSGTFRYRDIFEHIAPDFYFKFNVPGQATGIVEMETYEVESDTGGRFEEMFSLLKAPLAECCINQDQLLEICIFHPEKLMPNGVPNLLLLNLGDLPPEPETMVVIDLRIGKHALVGMATRPLNSGDFLERGEGIPFYRYLLVPNKPQP